MVTSLNLCGMREGDEEMIDSIPKVIPVGWRVIDNAGLRLLHRDMPNGLRAVFTVEEYGPDENPPTGMPGVYHRVSLSRRKMYPTWDEMKAFLRDCPLFDNSRGIIMVLPPNSEYVNLHPNCFHWFQRVSL